MYYKIKDAYREYFEYLFHNITRNIHISYSN